MTHPRLALLDKGAFLRNQRNNSVARRRGAAKENSNAFKHGLYCAPWREFRANAHQMNLAARYALARWRLCSRLRDATQRLEQLKEAYEVHKLIADTATALGSKASLRPAGSRPHAFTALPQ